MKRQVIHNLRTRDSTNLLVVANLLPAGWTLVSAQVGTFRVGRVDGFQWSVNDPPVASGATQVGRKLTFPVGVLEQTVAVPGLDDALEEDNTQSFPCW